MSVLLPFELIKYVQYKISCWNVQVVRERVDTLLLWRAQAEARAEFAERSVQKLQKEVDRLEGMSLRQFIKYPKQNISFSNKYNYYFQLKYIKLCIFFSFFYVSINENTKNKYFICIKDLVNFNINLCHILFLYILLNYKKQLGYSIV